MPFLVWYASFIDYFFVVCLCSDIDVYAHNDTRKTWTSKPVYMSGEHPSAILYYRAPLETRSITNNQLEYAEQDAKSSLFSQCRRHNCSIAIE